MSNSPDILQDFGSLANVRIGLSAEVRAQGVLTLNRLNFGLAPATIRQLDDQRIAAAYKNREVRR